MQEFVSYALLGLGAGAVYTLLAQGLVVIHRASGVLNFALGAQAMVAAYIQHALTGSMSTLLATIIAVLISAVIGVAVHLLIMQPLGRSAPLVRITAALSVLLLLQTGMLMHYGSDVQFPRSFLPQKPVDLLGTTIVEDRLILAAIAVGATIVLFLGYRYTSYGRATEAVATNPRLAASLGWSPTIIGAANWAVGSALAGFAGILITPLIQLQVTRMTLLIIPALAVAMVAGFRSFGLTLLAGMLVGILQSEMSNYVSSIQGVGEAAPLIIIVLVLMVSGRGIPARDFAHDHLPAVGPAFPKLKTAVPLAVGLIAVTLFAPTQYVNATMQTAIAAIVLISVVVVTGFAGQISLAQWAIAGVGAYGSGRLVAAQNWPFWAAFIIGVLTAIIIGSLFALPALRARGATLAVMTLGLGEAIKAVVFSNSKFTGQLHGTVVGGQSLFGISIDPIGHARRYTFLCLFFLLVVALVAGQMRRGRAGRRLLSVRENERAAAALGISVVQSKLYAFALASAMAGVAGVLYAFANHSVLYEGFDPFLSINFVTTSVLVGVGYLSGQPWIAIAAAGGGLGTVVMDNIGLNGNWVTLIGAILTLLTLISYPDGVAAAGHGAKKRFGKKTAAEESLEREEAADAPLARTVVTEIPADVAAAATAKPKVLEMSDITVKFGGVTALSDVRFSASPGEIVGLIGPNGAGKTTLIDVASGFVKPASGKIVLGGEDITHATRHHRARAGLSRSFQSLELFDDLSIRENLLTAVDDRDALAYLSNLATPGSQELPPAAAAAVDVFGLGAVLDQKPTQLAYGQRRLVAIARAAAAAPSVLLLDEPAAGLGRDQTDELGNLIQILARQLGQAVVLVEHDLEFVLRVSDRLVVLDRGRLLAEGEDPQEVVRRPEVRTAYLGIEDTPADAGAATDSHVTVGQD